MDQHLRYLDECAELHERIGKEASRAGVATDPLERMNVLNPDLMLEIAKEYLLHAGSEVGNGVGGTNISSGDAAGRASGSSMAAARTQGSSPGQSAPMICSGPTLRGGARVNDETYDFPWRPLLFVLQPCNAPHLSSVKL